MTSKSRVYFQIFLVFLQIFIKFDLKSFSFAKKLTQEMPNVMRNILLIKEDCGEVCDTSDRFKKNKGKYFEVIEKRFECDILLTSPIINPSVIKEEQMHNVRSCFISNII